MNYYEDEPKSNYPDLSHSGKGQQNRERAGIIPVTSLILNEAEVTKDESVLYQGVPLNDITIVGYIVDYKELESKIKMTLFDFTGSVEIYFFNKMGGIDTIGLNKFHYDGKKKPVQNNVLYHRTDVIHSWLYLTGKLNELKNNQVQNSAEEARNIAMGNSSSGYGFNGYNGNMKNTPMKNSGDKDMKDAINLLDNYAKKNRKNDISHANINNLLKKFGKNLGNIIDKLINNNKLIETDSGYEIMS